MERYMLSMDLVMLIALYVDEKILKWFMCQNLRLILTVTLFTSMSDVVIVAKDIFLRMEIKIIEANLIIPDIKQQFPSFTYEQIYDTIFYDSALNLLYREHGQKRLTAEHKKDKDGRF